MKKKTFLFFISYIVLSIFFGENINTISSFNPATTKVKYKDSILLDWKAKGDSTIYFGIHSNQTFLLDSIKLNPIGIGIIQIPNNSVEGIYFIGFPKRRGLFDFIYEKKSLHIVVNERNSPSYPNSKINQELAKYFEIISKQNNIARKLEDSTLQEKQKNEILKNLTHVLKNKETFINNYLKNGTGDYLELLFKLEKIPSLNDLLPLKTKQDTFNFIQAQINRYWQYVDFSDERIINTPMIIDKLNNYFDNILPLNIDTHKKRSIELIEKAPRDKKTFRFLLTYSINRYIQSKYVGFDAVFLEIYLKYLYKQDNKWLGEDNLATIEKKVNQIYFNQLNAPGKDFILLDTSDKSFNALSSRGKDGIIIAFWDPTCSHCKKEIPELNRLIKEEIIKKGKDLKILGVMVDGGKDNWTKFINKYNLSSDIWVHGYDTKQMRQQDYKNNIPNYRQLYGIDQTPIYYYLNKAMIIKAKGPINPQQLIQIINNEK